MTENIDNLKTAFAGESQANRKYLAFAKQADKDGYAVIARLFRATAEAETIHALGHLKAMDMIKTTEANLEAAIAGETYEFTEMYPPMLRQAEETNHKAKVMFKYAMTVENVHAQLYKKALEAVRAGKDLEDMEVYLCPICGHIEFGKPDGKCPVCNVANDKYEKVA
ncbi:MAG: rubrerythrin family protein [Nitrospinota bacterium]|nr:rubrerythrin family protein [Nitrospinota bacterium]